MGLERTESCLYERFIAGDSLDNLVEDYNYTKAEVESIIRKYSKQFFEQALERAELDVEDLYL